jgi:starch-binding outer membrane protein SusE/F
MKRYLNQIILLTGSAMVLFSSCIKEQSTVVFEGGTAPVLTSTATDSISLPLSDTTGTAVTFTWTNPNYTFNDGISSLDVNYYLEIDTLGANFTSPLMAQIGISSSLSQTFTVSQLNGVLTNTMQLDTSVMHHIQVRVESYLTPLTSGSANAAALYSDVLSYTVTPYATPPAVAPPPNDSLYIVGAAVLVDNWANPIPAADVPSETFTEISPTKYQITVALVGGGEYKLISQNNGSWTYQWSVATIDTEPNGGPFVFNGANCIAPAASGTYTIVVNFQTGTFTVTKQ